MAQRYPVIAREGWIPITFFLLVGLYALNRWSVAVAVISWSTAALLAFYFRDPPRRIPPSPLAVVSPADGRVLDVRTVRDERLARDATLIRLAMSSLGPFSMRSPIEGKVLRQWYPQTEQDYFAQWVQSDEHDDILLVALPRGRGRRPFCELQSGERVGQGQRCGFLTFGARIDVYLPTGCRVMVQPGDHVQSGVSVLAKLVHK